MIIIFGACHPLGQTAATAFADQGKRVLAVDDNSAGLRDLCAQNPGWIEAVLLGDMEQQLQRTLGDTWAGAQIEMVINLTPLTRSTDISAQMRTLTAIVKTTLRGLVRAQGTLVSVALRAGDPLAFVAHGMGAALSQASVALSGAVAAKGVRVHCITLPAGGGGAAAEMLKTLATPAGRSLRSTTLDLDRAAPKKAL